MKQLVIVPGGFHPFHAGHLALYQAAQAAFPSAEVYVAATNDVSARPFPFKIKEKLAQLAGVEPGHFVQVASPFRATEITQKFKPDSTVLIFVRSEKDQGNQPLPVARDPVTRQLPLVKRGPNKGQPVSNYLQYYEGNEKDLEPMNQHAYLAYLPTVEFGPGMRSATEIRTAWPGLNDRRKTALVMSLYPKTQTNPQLAATVVKMLDTAIGTPTDESADYLDERRTAW
jgi:glycerol-3-phosphate cytidylyltransferase-like family protein